MNAAPRCPSATTGALQGQLASALHFTGKPRDEETGLDFFGARLYASGLGRWMTPDWSATPEPVPYAQLDNPQSLNLYSYVLNNPVATTDPDGHYLRGNGTKDDGCTTASRRDARRLARDGRPRRLRPPIPGQQ